MKFWILYLLLFCSHFGIYFTLFLVPTQFFNTCVGTPRGCLYLTPMLGEAWPPPWILLNFHIFIIFLQLLRICMTSSSHLSTYFSYFATIMARPLLLFSRKISVRGTIPKVYLENELVSVILIFVCRYFSSTQECYSRDTQNLPFRATTSRREVTGNHILPFRATTSPPGGYR